jgi:hypothetical protein
MPYRERFGYMPPIEQRLYKGYMPRKRLNIAERLRVKDKGYVPVLRLCAARETPFSRTPKSS